MSPTKRSNMGLIVKESRPDPALEGEELRNRLTLIKVECLKLCQHMASALPGGARRERAIASVRAGVRLAIEQAEERLPKGA